MLNTFINSCLQSLIFTDLFQTSNIDHITAMACVSAEGRVLPSFLIYEKGLPNVSVSDDLPNSWMYGHSPNSMYIN